MLVEDVGFFFWCLGLCFENIFIEISSSCFRKEVFFFYEEIKFRGYKRWIVIRN